LPGFYSPLQILGDSVVAVATTTPASSALPTLASGEVPQFCLVSGATNNTYLGLGVSGVGSAVTDIFIHRGKFRVFATRGHSIARHVATAGTHSIIITPVAVHRGAGGPRAFQLSGNAANSQAVANTGTTEIAIPNDSQGSRAKAVLVTGDLTVYCKPGFTGDTLPATVDVLQLGQPVMPIYVGGYTHILARTTSGTPKQISVSALEG
jgi:hypothetical protein